MPIKFSSLTTKGIANTVKLVGLYNDNTSETGVSNCLVNVADFARKTELNNLDSSTVHKTGTEEIGGTKTFTAKDVILKNSAIDITDISTASSGSYEHISVKDVNNKEFGHFKSIFNNGKITTEIASNPDGGLDNFKSISVTVDTTTGVTTTSCPPPTETTSGTTTQIATAGWVNSTSVGNNVVHKSGTETITGTKTFKAHTYIKNDDVEQMTNPSSNSEKLFIFTDSNDVRIGSVGTSMTTDGYSRAYISASKKINGSNKYCSINAYIDKEGNTWTSAPTPAAGDNSTKIATTAWVNSKIIAGTGCFPNYASHAGRSQNTTYTAGTNGFLYIHIVRSNTSEGSIPITISGYTFTLRSNDYGHVFVWYPIAKGTTYTIGAQTKLSTVEITWFPAL